jgi:hypothetical protein
VALRGLRGCTRGCVPIPASLKTEDKPENQSSKSYLQVFGRYLSHFVIPDIFYLESIFSSCQFFKTALAVPRTAESEKIQQWVAATISPKEDPFPLDLFRWLTKN